MAEIKAIGVNIKGIHFHCGSGMHGSSAFKKGVLLARECLKIGREYGHEMSIMDVGGGFPAGDLNESTIEALHLTKDDPLGYTVIAEPGRHFCSRSFYLLTRVIGKRTKNDQVCYHLNESLYHSFNCNVMDAVSFDGTSDQFYRAISSKKEVDITEVPNSTIFGMTCDGIDVIARNIAIPILKIGDWICVSGMGAYTVGSKSTFNGMRCTETIFTWRASFGKCEDSAETSSSDESS
jgi:diaminopimelate decarboxylase